jgi:hypothetical protein
MTEIFTVKNNFKISDFGRFSSQKELNVTAANYGIFPFERNLIIKVVIVITIHSIHNSFGTINSISFSDQVYRLTHTSF